MKFNKKDIFWVLFMLLFLFLVPSTLLVFLKGAFTKYIVAIIVILTSVIYTHFRKPKVGQIIIISVVFVLLSGIAREGLYALADSLLLEHVSKEMYNKITEIFLFGYLFCMFILTPAFILLSLLIVFIKNKKGKK